MPSRRRLRLPTLNFCRPYTSGRRFLPVDVLRDENVSDFNLEEPVLLNNRFSNLPAIAKWFEKSERGESLDKLNSAYFERHCSTSVPLELTRSTSSSPEYPRTTSFERFEAPFSLLIAHITSSCDPYTRLYLAQCPLEDLPAELQADLPTPDLVSRIGKGDIYGSSLWMGKPPTRTPLHRDPNPNLFVQLAGKKVIRLMKPEDGKALYMSVRAGMGHANMRGLEMMAGEEHERLEEAVWNENSAANSEVSGYEAVLESGHGLFIPVGWWHAVRGFGRGVNGSVNWWFR